MGQRWGRHGAHLSSINYMVDTWDLNSIFKISNYGYTEPDAQSVG